MRSHTGESLYQYFPHPLKKDQQAAVDRLARKCSDGEYTLS